MKSLLSVVVFLSTVLGANAFADASGPGEKAFYQTIKNHKQACAGDVCSAPFKAEDAFSADEPEQSSLAVDVQAVLKNVAIRQAQVWGDTILEGDYQADGHTRLDVVTFLYKNNSLIGYRISYSERAWYTGECDFNGDDEETLKDCTEGRIFESSYVSPDFKTYFRDEDDLADFVD